MMSIAPESLIEKIRSQAAELAEVYALLEKNEASTEKNKSSDGERIKMLKSHCRMSREKAAEYFKKVGIVYQVGLLTRNADCTA